MPYEPMTTDHTIRPARWQAHADRDGLPPGQPEPVQGQPVTVEDIRRMFGL